MATSDGILSVRVSDGTTTVPAEGADAREITFKAWTIQPITATEIGGAGDDEVDAGLGDDAIDLTQGGEDAVIYRYATDAMGNPMGA